MIALEKTVEAARGRWREILLRFGLDEKFLRDEHGPCPMCGGTDRYRWDNTDGNGGYYCSQCGPGSGMHLLMALRSWDFPRAAKEVDSILGVVHRDPVQRERTEESKRDYMRRLFRESRPVAPGDPVDTYLTRRCGDVSGLLGDIRTHPGLRHKVAGTTHPVMLAFMGWDAKLRKFSGIHRTFLSTDGHKAPVDPAKMSYGDAGVVRLGPPAERMGIAEGIETALCARQLFGVPVWSGICAEGLKAWTPPPEAKEVLICGDNDGNFVGQAATYDLAKRLRAHGLAVDIRIPPQEDEDWADVWAKAQQSTVAA